MDAVAVVDRHRLVPDQSHRGLDRHACVVQRVHRTAPGIMHRLTGNACLDARGLPRGAFAGRSDEQPRDDAALPQIRTRIGLRGNPAIVRARSRVASSLEALRPFDLAGHRDS